VPAFRKHRGGEGATLAVDDDAQARDDFKEVISWRSTERAFLFVAAKLKLLIRLH
jgi:5'-deoxynucleotidase YfbR-like HD superfamily hydrolase